MTPIISPWVFYLISLSTPVKAVVGTVIAFILITWFAIWLFEEGDYKPKTSQKIIVVLLILIEILVPSESTIMKMLVAQNVTYERVEMVGETVQDVYNDIISLIDSNEDDE